MSDLPRTQRRAPAEVDGLHADERRDDATGPNPPRLDVTLLEGPGFRVRHDGPRLAASLIEAARRHSVATLGDATNRMFAFDAGLRCVAGRGRGRVHGSALTVRVFPGDNLMVHQAIPLACPGDVLVVDASRSPSAVIGGQVAARAKARGIVACVIDGLVRDLDELEAVGIMVFARGSTCNGPFHRGPGEINYPVSCGGLVVQPGDLVALDGSGGVVVEHASVPLLLARLGADVAAGASHSSAAQPTDTKAAPSPAAHADPSTASE